MKTTKQPSTVSIAVPGSVVDNAQTLELATAVAGQVARAAAIFNIDEVVVLDDSAQHRCPLAPTFTEQTFAETTNAFCT